MLLNLIVVGGGGFIGSIARFWIANELQKHITGTWIANISGSLLLAIIYRLYANGVASELIWLLFGVGFCGAYTTFSTFGKETLILLLEKQYGTAIIYVLSSFLLSFLLVSFAIIW